jgi:hypothetical protein
MVFSESSFQKAIFDFRAKAAYLCTLFSAVGSGRFATAKSRSFKQNPLLFYGSLGLYNSGEVSFKSVS